LTSARRVARVARRRRRLGDASKLARCYISITFVLTLIIRDSTTPTVTRGLTNDLSDAIDRVIESFSIFLCARHSSHAIKALFADRHWRSPIVIVH